MAWYEEGKNPDYRFSLANERTYLAWIRTALAILAGAVFLKQFSNKLPPQILVSALAVALCVLSAVISVFAWVQWRRYEHAMRLDQALPRSLLMPILTLAAVLLVLTQA